MCEYKLNRFNKKILDAIKDLLSIEENVGSFIAEGTQESLDHLVLKINSFDQRWENTKISLVTLIKIISGDDEIDVEETENGLEL